MSVFTGWWSERAQRAEQDADRLAAILDGLRVRGQLDHIDTPSWNAVADTLRDYRGNRERRYVALPAGHTLEGSLKSGGWQ